MTMEPAPLLTLWGAKLAGAAAGSAISVAYLLPKSRREAATRFLIGLVTGVVFGAPAGLMLADRLALGRLADSFGRDGPLRALGTGADTPRAGDRRE